jgi:hypothetical protein
MRTIKIANVFFDPATFIYAEETSGGIRIFLTGLPAERQYVFVSFSKASVRSEAFKQLQKDVEIAIAWRK